LFRKKKKEEDETPEGYFKAFEDGVNVDIEVDDMVDDVEDSYYI
jgi:ribosomal protein L21E